MLIWISLIAYLLLLRVFLGSFRPKCWTIPYLLWAGIGIVFVMGLRYPGYPWPNTDLVNYYNLYKTAIYVPLFELLVGTRMEWGYIAFNKALATVIPWPQFILFAEAIICVSCSFYFIFKHSKDVFPSVMFYVTLGLLGFQLTGFRQSIAMSICLLAIDPARRHQLLRFSLVLLLAFSFHRTALVFVPFYFIANQPLTSRLLALYTFGVLGFLLVMNKVVVFGNTLTQSDYGSGFVGSALGGILSLVICAIAFTLLWWRRKQIDDYVCINMAIFWFILYCMRFDTLVFERLSFYFSIAVAVILTNAISNLRTKYYRILFYGVSISLAVVLFLSRAQSADWGNYLFMWQ